MCVCVWPILVQAEFDVDALVEEIYAVGDKTGNGSLTYPEYFKVCLCVRVCATLLRVWRCSAVCARWMCFFVIVRSPVVNDCQACQKMPWLTSFDVPIPELPPPTSE